MNKIEKLKNDIKAVIKTNGNQEITGQLLQDMLIKMIDTAYEKFEEPLFKVVTELPTEDIEQNTVYLVANKDSKDVTDKFIEYTYINNSWEKLGEFKAEVDLSHIEAKLDNKADLDKAGYVKVEQLVPAITYDKEANIINGAFEILQLDKLDNIVKSNKPINDYIDGDYQYYDLSDTLDDDVVPQYIYDATTNEYIEITACNYEELLFDAFNTAKPLDLTHDLYLDNEQTGEIEGLTKLEKIVLCDKDFYEGYFYLDLSDTLDDDVVPQYIYDATADEHIEITDTTYGEAYFDAFNTEKPLDLTHDLYLDNEQTGVIESIRKLKIDKAVSDSILINESISDVSNNNKITNNIVVSTAAHLISGGVDFKNNIIINASATGKIANAKNGILISTDDNARIISGSIVIGSSNSNTTTTEGCILIGNIKKHGKSNEINIGQRNTSGLSGIIIGNNSTSYNSSVGIGAYNTVTGAFSIAIGENCNVSPDNVVCIGHNAKANKNYDKAIVIGYQATTGPDFTYYRIENAIAIGTKAKAVNENSISIGTNSISSGESIAIGNNAKAEYSSCVAIRSESNANYVTAINSSIKNHAKGGVYLGYFTSYNNKDIQFAVGGNRPDNDGIYYNIEETLTYSNQHKKYIYGIGGYDGTNTATEGIKSLQEVLADKADASAIPTKVSQLTNDANFLTPDDNVTFAGLTVNNNAKIRYIQKSGGNEGTYLLAETPADRVANKVYAADGSLFDVSKLIKSTQCNISGDRNNVELGYTTVDGTYNFTVIPTVTTNHSGIMTAADKVKLDSLPSITSKLVNITTATTAEEVVTKFNALLADLKAKGYMEADA